MKDLLLVQVFGLDGLVNLSNLVFLLAFSVRDMFVLRILAVASYCLVLPYYYLQPTPLWPPLFWAVTFIVINSVRIALLAGERRPVVLSGREDRLYRLAFRSVDKREFLRLTSLARWVDYAPGELVLKAGQQISDAMVLISGEVDAIAGGRTVMSLYPGQLIGDANAYSGLPSPVDVRARGPVSVAKWDLEVLRRFTEGRPTVRAQLLRTEAKDLATKLQRVAGIGAVC
jgi:hypothetical protein